MRLLLYNVVSLIRKVGCPEVIDSVEKLDGQWPLGKSMCIHCDLFHNQWWNCNFQSLKGIILSPLQILLKFTKSKMCILHAVLGGFKMIVTYSLWFLANIYRIWYKFGMMLVVHEHTLSMFQGLMCVRAPPARTMDGALKVHLEEEWDSIILVSVLIGTLVTTVNKVNLCLFLLYNDDNTNNFICNIF